MPDDDAPGQTGEGPEVADTYVHFRVDDPDGSLEAVRLYQEVARPRFGPEFVRFTGSDCWELMLPRPAADRIEYLLQVTRRGGDVETGPDAANPRRAPGPFGDKSVVEFPGYRAPTWLDHPAPDGELGRIEVPAPPLEATFEVTLWTAPGHSADEPLPLLLVHDGPEYALYSGLLALLDRETVAGLVPPLHVALLQPVDRDAEYTANPAWAETVADHLLPAVEAAVAVGEHPVRIGLGASLGALAMLHLHRTRPECLDALVLQSGSFFRAGADDHEAWLDSFERITDFTAGLATTPAPRTVPVHLTCGTVEENLQANRALRDVLAGQGYDVTLTENRDGHTWTAWRDTLDPVLTDMLRRVAAG